MTGHASIRGEATCQTMKGPPKLLAKLESKARRSEGFEAVRIARLVARLQANSRPSKPVQRVLSQVTTDSGDLVVPTRGLNAGEWIRWASDDGK